MAEDEMRVRIGELSKSANLLNFSIKFRRIQTHQPCNDQTHHKKDLFATVYIPKGWVNRLATVTTFMITIVKLFSPEPRPIVPAARGRVGLCSGSRERAARSWIFPTSQLRSPAAVKACFVHHGESSHSQFRCTCNCTFAQGREESWINE